MTGEGDELRRRGIEMERWEQRERSQLGRKSNAVGRWFHLGIAEMRGEIRENGWRAQRSIRLPSGRERIHDNARSVNDNEFREYKGAQYVGGEFVMEQISKEREHLYTDPRAKGAWIVIEGAPDSAARRELERLEQDFKDRFQLIEVSKHEAKRAEALGRELERNRDQLELFKSTELRAKERIRELQEKAREKARTQVAAKEALEKLDRERQIRGAEQRQREAVERVAEYARRQRENAARGLPTPMDPRAAADILRIQAPPPGRASPFRKPPQPTRGGRSDPGRQRDLGPREPQ